MNTQEKSPPAASGDQPNGSGAAAILSAGVGTFMVGVLAIAADKFHSIQSLFIFYKPPGPLSGVTTIAILFWLLTWAVLEARWRKRNVALTPICFIAFVLLGMSLLLTFPPIADLF